MPDSQEAASGQESASADATGCHEEHHDSSIDPQSQHPPPIATEQAMEESSSAGCGHLQLDAAAAAGSGHKSEAWMDPGVAVLPEMWNEIQAPSMNAISGGSGDYEQQLVNTAEPPFEQRTELGAGNIPMVVKVDEGDKARNQEKWESYIEGQPLFNSHSLFSYILSIKIPLTFCFIAATHSFEIVQRKMGSRQCPA